MFRNRLFRPVLMSEEGLDTASFFGGQDLVDESALPDAADSPVLLDNPDAADAVDQLPEDGQEADPNAQQPADKGRKQFVSLGALQEERTKRQEIAEQNRVLQERMNQFLQAQLQQQQVQQVQQQQPKEELPAIPAFIDDPEGHVKALVEQHNREMAEVRQYIQQQAQAQQGASQQQQLAMQVGAQEAEFRKTTPDYDAALEHFNARKITEYTTLGLDELQARQQLARDYQGVAMRAQQLQCNPADLMYRMAKAVGYTGQQQQSAPPKTPPTSLSNLPGDGKAPDQQGAVNAKAIAAMTNEEFDKFFNDMARNSVQRPAF